MTLYELNHLVHEVVESGMPNEYWVEAELSECRELRGHCYMELIQYGDGGEETRSRMSARSTPIAKASAKCWASKWMLIRPCFERIAGQSLRAGMKVLLKVCPQFHEAYGFSWIVTDIDPTYTLGDMARKRQEIVRQLKEEGIFDLQKELELPLFCQHIAVISSETAAGYGDFCNQLADNPYGFRFRTQLFPATMQGEDTERSVISALESIFRSAETQCSPFDCVVIIRGGGAVSDMSCFDTLALAENVANFPLPVITGIGHDRDESILDMVSHTRVKTPTAAAAFLVAHLKEVLDTLNDAQNRIAQYSGSKLFTLHSRLSTLSEVIPRLFSVVKTRQDAKLDELSGQISLLLERRMTAERHRLEMAAEKVKSLDPALLLKRGYSITLHNGKAVRDPKTLKAGDEIETRLEKGTVISTVTPIIINPQTT